MTARTRYQTGNALLAIAAIILAVRLLGLAGVIPRAGQWDGMALLALAFFFVAHRLRRGARAEMAAERVAKPTS
jgi:hypothetical protein